MRCLSVSFWSSAPTYWLVFPPELELTVKLFVSPGPVGLGMNFNSSSAAGLMEAVGMELLANCVRPQAAADGMAAGASAVLTLRGSKIGTSAGNTPVRSSMVGTVVVVVD